MVLSFITLKIPTHCLLGSKASDTKSDEGNYGEVGSLHPPPPQQMLKVLHGALGNTSFCDSGSLRTATKGLV
jgi:hypothetical protein